MSTNRTTADSELPATAREVAALIAEVLSALPQATAARSGHVERLRGLGTRLAAARLQIAVVGQFKRGKSSLLNALLGVSVLPMGVVPLTAVTTMLAGGPLLLRRDHLDGGQAERVPADLDGLRTELATLVTEEGNPDNRLGLRRVEIRLPVPLLAHGMVLLDTPGIGSTLRHNTDAALAALPECDLALFVVSPDPPITEAELAYLAQVRAAAAHIVVVLNKVDVQEPAERAISLRFLRRVLAGQAGLPAETAIFPVSAQAALTARARGDAAALAASGVPALERHLLHLLATAGPAVLAAAVAGKAAAVVAALRLDAEIAARALRLPRAELDRRIAAFDAGIADLAVARTDAADRIAGDRTRLHALIEQEVAAAATRSRQRLEQAVTDLPRGNETLAAARRHLAVLVPEVFAPATAAATASVQAAMTETLRRHQDRIARLIGDVQRNAAATMELRCDITQEAISSELPQLAAWHTDGRTETLASISTDWMERLLPPGLRRRRVQRRLGAEAAAITLRNVEATRWSLHQDLDAAVRRFAGELDTELDAAIAASRQAMTAARQVREETARAIEAAAAEADAVAGTLGRIERSLRTLHREPAPVRQEAETGSPHSCKRDGVRHASKAV